MSETFGRYTVVKQLGKGAMGVVYLATDPALNRQVAVKTVDLSVQSPQERQFLRDRLFRDARAAAVLKHPNIVSIYDVFEDAGRAYVVMEYIEGDSLAALLKVNPKPAPADMLKVLGQMADALDYTHAHGVIHRDIKPGNVMIDPTGATKIMDFGIARIMDSRTCTPTGMVMGTVEYMAPEQIRGDPVDGRVDQFALAVVAYQMMTGTTLFGPGNVATLTYKIVNEAPPPPSAHNADLPRGVDAVQTRALAKNPADRFATCTDFVKALAAAYSGASTAPVPVPVKAPEPAPAPAMPTPAPVAVAQQAAPSQVPVVLAALAVVVLGLVFAAVVFKPWTRFLRPEVPKTGVSAPPATAPPEAVPPAADKPVAEVAPAPVPVAPKTDAPTSGPPASTDPPRTEPAKSEPVKSDAPPAAVAASVPAAELEPAPVLLKPESTPTPFSDAMQRGQQQVTNKDYTGALKSFGDAVRLRPDSAPAHYSRATMFQHFAKLDVAMSEYYEAVRLDPRMPLPHVGLGACMEQLHRDTDALLEYQKALTLNPNAFAALFGRANVYLRRKEYGAALADFDHALKIRPRFAPAYDGRALAKEGVGDSAGAAADKRMAESLRKQ